ncbi:hypothetical protein L593_06335 [Salinarchaeum sp. Harcht-Bsk1]|uniref:hypothetical protein n=1 Tax=Salinarchaeum sp. Harcht-Bsk1 TaxID=1333523 RepID=UPI0003423680|nr:hypothetical protein [Salinarchaeum sp. Harcht-Bsk1]AGN01214.1 hypothetical protein L593_06335 [Salinarchaeum sp. Harcht-Bsk1]
MVDSTWFSDLPDEFEESVRIDRQDRSEESFRHRTQAIESYHVTSDSQAFLEDVVERTLDEAEDMRTGSNYWLYGYYGSGKSHLLTVLEGLMDSSWVAGQYEEVWSDLVPAAAEGRNLETLRERWEDVHADYHVIPVSVNLLKYQGQKKRSFSEIVLRHAHQHPTLTGVDNGISTGLSAQLGVAYFEDWYRTTPAWDDRQALAADVVEEVVPDTPRYDWPEEQLWKDIQQYSALSDVVLPALFEGVQGTRDGYTDLQPSDIDPNEVVSRLESLRQEREETMGTPVKLVLLLDEVSLFIGTDFERLTELQTLAENVDDIGDGNIQLVATAQAKIEDVQPKFAAHGADFSIVKDRFPHRYQLPSKHVGDIAKRRLFAKSETGEASVRQVLDEADVKPGESLVYNDIRQNTKPPLDEIDEEALVEYYPFLPYHAPLFLEILFNLRREANDPAKSIFSGTARAILALMHGLLEEWIEEGEDDTIVTLVDFFDLIEPELREILSSDMRVIEGSNPSPDAEDGSHAASTGEIATSIVAEVNDTEREIREFDLKVAKAVLLLRQVNEIVPLNEGNIAVAVMSDLNGRSWISTTNRVEDSLDRLEKYIRPTEDGSSPRYRFATQEERLIYHDAEENEANPNWDEIVEALDEHLWADIARELSLPDSAPYKESGAEYPVSYHFEVDGVAFSTSQTADGGLDVDIAIHGIRPDVTTDQDDPDVLHWEIDSDGLQDLRESIVDWWALRNAIASHDVPPAVEQDLDRRSASVRSKLVSAMSGGSYSVNDRTDISGLSTAVQETVDVSYPDDFHPMLLQVDESRLRELRELDSDAVLPQWAEAIQVPTADHGGDDRNQTIRRNVMSLTGRQLHGRDEGLTLETILDGIVEKKPFYSDARPALCAIIWGLCRRGRLVAVDEAGNTLDDEAVLDIDTTATTRLQLLSSDQLGNLLETGGFKETTDTVAEGLINLQEENRRIHSTLRGLHEDVTLIAETDVRADEVGALLDAFADELAERMEDTKGRIAVVKSQSGDLEGVIEGTNEVGEWLSDVTDVWNRRLSQLQQLDAVLTIGDRDFEWIDDDAQRAIETRSESVASYDGEWWTAEGWKTFSEQLVPDLAPELGRAWQEFVDQGDIDALVERIDDNPWILPATSLPTGVHASFERTYITPMRQFVRWFETLDEALTTLPSDSDAGAYVEIADDTMALEPMADAFDDGPEDLAAKLDGLSAIVGERTPDDVDQIGIVPSDRDKLQRRLERLAEDGDLDVEDSGQGVIIR